MNDHKALVEQIEALLDLDKRGALAPHGIGHHARALFGRCISALSPQPASTAQEMEAVAWTRNDLAKGLAHIDGITLRDIKSTVGDPKDASNWREYLGRADDLMAQLSWATSTQPASTALVERLTKALEPFADAADYFSNGVHRPIAEDALPCGPALIVKHLREARAALSASSKEGESRG